MWSRTPTNLAAALALSFAGTAWGQTSRPAATQPAGDEVVERTPAKGKADEKAAALAARVMETMGGAKAWAETRVITWTFFGSRRHVWDKATGDIRMEGGNAESGKQVIVMNLNSGAGRAWRNGTEMTTGNQLEKALEQARSAWINDSYWLVMPYKLRDPGVTLRSMGPKQTAAGNDAEVLELTFEGVGATPQNKYHVYVGTRSGLVEQWDFFRTAADTESVFQSPWTGWKKYGRIMLSGGRGQMRGRDAKLTDIAVMDEPPAGVFTDPNWTPPASTTTDAADSTTND